MPLRVRAVEWMSPLVPPRMTFQERWAFLSIYRVEDEEPTSRLSVTRPNGGRPVSDNGTSEAECRPIAATVIVAAS
jgi:hypothetical protein